MLSTYSTFMHVMWKKEEIKRKMKIGFTGKIDTHTQKQTSSTQTSYKMKPLCNTKNIE